MGRIMAITGLLTLVITNIEAQYPPNIRLTYNDLDQHETSISISPVNTKIMMATWNDFPSPACFSHFPALH